MTTFYIITGLIVVGILIKIFQTKKENNLPYLKIKKKLEDDLMQANFSGDWKLGQKINLQLLWLKTLIEVESRDMFGNKKDSDERTLLAKLSFEDIKFPTKWKLDDFYCYPFSQNIISAYGKILAKNDYNGMFKPDTILPVPKDFIRKAILFMFDYLNLKGPMYEVKDKDKFADNLNGVNAMLNMMFIDSENIDLPKESLENFKVGDELKKRQKKRDDLEDLKLIDWRSDHDWIIRGAHYANAVQYDFALACFDQAKKINPQNKDLKAVLAPLYFLMAQQFYEKGEKNHAIDYVKKSAELQYEDAINWLKENN